MTTRKFPRKCDGPCPATFRDVMAMEDRDECAKFARTHGFRGYWLDKATSGSSLDAELNRIELREDGYYDDDEGEL